MTFPIGLLIFGHVDHGKSTLAGHLLYKVGKFSQHDVEQAEKEADALKMSRCKWSFLLDACNEERAKGKTHDYAVVPFEHDGQNYELIDTPGHQAFVRAAIAGMAYGLEKTSGRVCGIVIVSVIPNEFEAAFERGMLKEQCILARAAGVENIVVTMNKIDKGLDNYENIMSKMKAFLKQLRFKKVEYVKTSGFCGDGLDDLLTSATALCNKNVELKKSAQTATETDRARTRFRILNCEGIISAGFECVAHIGTAECKALVIEMEKVFARKGEQVTCLFGFDDKVQIGEGTRIILRQKQYTIGYAICF